MYSADGCHHVWGANLQDPGGYQALIDSMRCYESFALFWNIEPMKSIYNSTLFAATEFDARDTHSRTPSLSPPHSLALLVPSHRPLVSAAHSPRAAALPQ